MTSATVQIERGGGESATNSSAGESSDSCFTRNMRILLCDDEKLSRMVIRNLLQKAGYLVECVENGRHAIEKLRQSPEEFSLVMSDVVMPEVNGLDLLRYVRSEPKLRAVPVVMMSAHEEAATVFDCIRNGAEDYLLKPVTPKEVTHIWQHVWRRRQKWQRAPLMSPLGDESLGTEDGDDEGTELLTSAEMRTHCLRQIERYQKVIEVIDSHAHLFPEVEGSNT